MTEINDRGPCTKTDCINYDPNDEAGTNCKKWYIPSVCGDYTPEIQTNDE